MRVKHSDLWTWKGTVDRGPYVLLGVGLFFIKYCIDRLIVRSLTGKEWIPLHYWTPGDFFGLFTDSSVEGRTMAILLLTALPFIWAGVVLTLRRLRATRLPVWLVPLFFVPVVNVLLFTLLAILPSRPQDAGDEEKDRVSLPDRLLPRGGFGSILVSVAVTMVIATALTTWGTAYLRSYGWGLFVGIPFLQGLLSALIYGHHAPRTFMACVAVATGSLAVTAVALIAIAVEGAVCIAMAAPFAFPIAVFGSFVGYLLQKGRAGMMSRRHGAFGLLLALPLLLGAEAATEPEPPLIEVRTAVEIDAPPERVWRHVVSFSELPPARELIFRAGIAHPVRAEIDGSGPGAVRRCMFTTGPFIEPIEVWEEPRLLAFRVEAVPPPMVEWTPYRGIHPPHVEGYFVSRRGQFLLERLPDGRTRLEGTTWYTHRMWPQSYWTLWSDAILHRIHERVLRHVRRLAEEDRP